MNIFEIATKEKYRYPYNGMICTEDLWDLSAKQLDAIYKALCADKKHVDEESLLQSESKEDETLNNKIEIVRFVFREKQAAIAERLHQAEIAEKKRRIADLIAEKEDQELSNQSIEALRKMLTEL